MVIIHGLLNNHEYFTSMVKCHGDHAGAWPAYHPCDPGFIYLSFLSSSLGLGHQTNEPWMWQLVYKQVQRVN
jgi:hypothetical protein